MTRSLDRFAREAAPEPPAEAVPKPRTGSADDRPAELSALLSSGPAALPVPKIARRVDAAQAKRFEPGRLGIPYAEPEWNDFKPGPAGKFGSSLPGYKKAHQTAVLKYRLALTDYRQRERQRIEEYNAAKIAYDEDIAERVERHNVRAARINEGLAAGDPRSVATYAKAALAASPFPEWLPLDRTASFRPSSRELTVRMVLPRPETMPDDGEPGELYDLVLARLALRSLREAFSVMPPGIVERVRVRGELPGADGSAARLVDVRGERTVFADVNLEQLDPLQALRQLGGRLSPDAYGRVPIDG